MTTQADLLAWLNGTVDGGPNGDGKYPLIDKQGVTHLVLCPAAQAATDAEDISIPDMFRIAAEEARDAALASQNAAAASATAAANSALAASGSEANAALSMQFASESEGNAQVARDDAEASATAAAGSATAAAGSATTASTANTNAQAAKTAAETARDLAQQWASNAEDVVVTGGQYSARHWAAKAAASALSVNAANLVTIAGIQEITGAKTFSSNAVRIDATAGQNAHLYLRDDTAINRALFYWDRATDQAVVRRYKSDGTAAEGQMLIGSGWIKFDTKLLQADFSNATLSSRAMLQTSVVNGATNVGVIPNGTGTAALYSVFNSSDPTNAGGMQFRADAADMFINSFKTGTAITRDIVFSFDSVNAARLKTNGELYLTNHLTTTGRVIRNSADGEWGFLGRNAAGSVDRGGIWHDSAGVALYNASFLAGVHVSNTGTVGLTGNVTMQAGKNLKWGNAIQQHITLWETSTTAGNESSYGIGVQNSTWYARSDAAFAFYYKGTHAATKFDPGSNGKMLMNMDLDSNGVAVMGIGGAHAGTASAVIVHRGALGTQQGHYALAQGGARLWQLGVETDRSFKIWQYDDAGGFQSTGLTIGRGGSMRLLPTTGLHLDVGWFRSQQLNTGWYHEAGAGGWFMSDTSWVRNYNNKPICITNNSGGTVARWESPSPTFEFYDTDEGTTSWMHLNGGSHGFLQHNSFAWSNYRDSSNNWICVSNIAAYASDARLKTNAQLVRDFVIDRFFDGIEIEEYDWDAAAIAVLNPGFVPTAWHEVGARAQKVELVFKGMVHTRGSVILDGQEHEGIKTLLWEKAVPFTVAGVQRLRAENVALKQRVTTLEEQMATVLARLAQLENAA